LTFNLEFQVSIGPNGHEWPLGSRVGLQKHLVEKYPIAFAVVSPACVVIHRLSIVPMGRKFGAHCKGRGMMAVKSQPNRG